MSPHLNTWHSTPPSRIPVSPISHLEDTTTESTSRGHEHRESQAQRASSVSASTNYMTPSHQVQSSGDHVAVYSLSPTMKVASSHHITSGHITSQAISLFYSA
mmetsp:Transcript_25457/g.30890  ORF Transcript_25457/g.30890 Transcript_25457/m.30890 type:complete len:103 (-) Transcript_25457:1833-2141(-)